MQFIKKNFHPKKKKALSRKTIHPIEYNINEKYLAQVFYLYLGILSNAFRSKGLRLKKVKINKGPLSNSIPFYPKWLPTEHP